MINHYLRSAIILLGLVLSFPSNLHAFDLLAPKPTINDMMWDGFFARDLIKKRPVFLKAGGGYPSIMIGGTVEAGLVNKLKPQLDTVTLDSVVSFNSYILLAVPVSLGEVKGSSSSKSSKSSRSRSRNRSSSRAPNKAAHKSLVIDRWAVIVGESSRYHTETQIGSVRLPFSLYGAIGRFDSPTASWRSKMTGAKNIFRSTAFGRKKEQLLGLLMGVQRDFDVCTINFQVQPFFCKKFPKEFQWLWDMNLDISRQQPNYSANVSLGYSPKEKYFNLSGNFSKDHFKVGGQWWWEQQSSRKLSAGVYSDAGRIEGSYQVILPKISVPSEIIVGYSWGDNPLEFKRNEYTGLLQVIVHKYLHIRVGAKAEIQRKTNSNSKKHTLEWPVRVLQLNVIF